MSATLIAPHCLLRDQGKGEAYSCTSSLCAAKCSAADGLLTNPSCLMPDQHDLHILLHLPGSTGGALGHEEGKAFSHRVFLMLLGEPCCPMAPSCRQVFALWRIGRLERTSILHSGNSTLRPAINLSSVMERPLKMITFFTMNALPCMDSVASQAARRPLCDTTRAVLSLLPPVAKRAIPPGAYDRRHGGRVPGRARFFESRNPNAIPANGTIVGAAGTLNPYFESVKPEKRSVPTPPPISVPLNCGLPRQPFV